MLISAVKYICVNDWEIIFEDEKQICRKLKSSTIANYVKLHNNIQSRIQIFLPDSM